MLPSRALRRHASKPRPGRTRRQRCAGSRPSREQSLVRAETPSWRSAAQTQISGRPTSAVGSRDLDRLEQGHAEALALEAARAVEGGLAVHVGLDRRCVQVAELHLRQVDVERLGAAAGPPPPRCRSARAAPDIAAAAAGRCRGCRACAALQRPRWASRLATWSLPMTMALGVQGGHGAGLGQRQARVPGRPAPRRAARFRPLRGHGSGRAAPGAPAAPGGAGRWRPARSGAWAVMYQPKQGLAPHGVHTYDTRPMPEDGSKLCNVAVLADEARPGRTGCAARAAGAHRAAADVAPKAWRRVGWAGPRNRGASSPNVDAGARLVVRCQRCLEPMQLPIESQFARCAGGSPKRLWPTVPPELETALAPEGRLRLADLVEEELLLALPAAPRHPEGQCPQGLGRELKGRRI